MEWTKRADNALKSVPFFVRKKVRARVDSEAAGAGKRMVTLADVKASQKRYLAQMSADIKGYQIDTCFGPGGCPNRTIRSEKLLEKIEALLETEDLLSFLKERVLEDLKYHHEFRITLAECPNACSQPQIKDIGIIGALVPSVCDTACSLCGDCVSTCPESCIHLSDVAEKPVIDPRRCLSCGKCVGVCPTHSLQAGQKGYRIQLAGKLGRHPRLARELPGVHTQETVLEIVRYCIRFYKQNSRHGERFSQIFGASDFDVLVDCRNLNAPKIDPK